MLKVSSRLFPIGYIISVDAPNFNPHDFYIDGNWERIKGRVIVGIDESQTEFNTLGKTGGSKTHTLTEAQIPKHSHSAITSRIYSGTTADQTVGIVIDDGNTFNYPSRRNYSNIMGGSDDNGAWGQAHNNLQPYQTAYMWKLISYSN